MTSQNVNRKEICVNSRRRKAVTELLSEKRGEMQHIFILCCDKTRFLMDLALLCQQAPIYALLSALAAAT